jgi:predicted small lipoprotein YifL
MNLKRVSRLSAASLTALLLFGCGQKGPLYLPDKTSAVQGGEELSALRAATSPASRQR